MQSKARLEAMDPLETIKIVSSNVC